MGYIPNYSHLLGIMIINHWENGVHYFQTHPYTQNCFDMHMSIYTHFTYIYEDKRVCIYILYYYRWLYYIYFFIITITTIITKILIYCFIIIFVITIIVFIVIVFTITIIVFIVFITTFF